MAPLRGWILLYFVAFAGYSTTDFGLICQCGVYNKIFK